MLIQVHITENYNALFTNIQISAFNMVAIPHAWDKMMYHIQKQSNIYRNICYLFILASIFIRCEMGSV